MGEPATCPVPQAVPTPAAWIHVIARNRLVNAGRPPNFSAKGQIAAQRGVEPFARVHQQVISTRAGARPPAVSKKSLHCLQVRAFQGSGIGMKLDWLLQAAKKRVFTKRKGQLVVVQNMEDNHLVPPQSELSQRIGQD